MPQIPVNKQYGDQQAIDSLVRQGSGLKQAASDTVPTVRNPVGRPPGGAGTLPTATPGAANPTAAPTAPEAGLPPEHLEMMKMAAKKAAFAQMSAEWAENELYGPWLTEYSARMRDEADARLRDVKINTPDYAVE